KRPRAGELRAQKHELSKSILAFRKRVNKYFQFAKTDSPAESMKRRMRFFERSAPDGFNSRIRLHEQADETRRAFDMAVQFRFQLGKRHAGLELLRIEIGRDHLERVMMRAARRRAGP